MDTPKKTRRAATALTDEERERLTIIANHHNMTASEVIRWLINLEFRCVTKTRYETTYPRRVR